MGRPRSDFLVRCQMIALFLYISLYDLSTCKWNQINHKICLVQKRINMNDRIVTSEYIDKYKAIYKTLKPIRSKAIGDKIYFNMPGFKHLIFKGKHRRETNAILNRLVLIPLIALVIHNCNEEVETRIRNEIIDGKRIKVTYYALESQVGKEGVRVRVVTR